MRRGARGKHHDSVGQRNRLLEIVCDEYHRLAVGGPQLEQLVLHQLPRLNVERRKRLVHEQNSRIQDEHLRERGAFAHSTGELVGVALAESAQAHALQPGVTSFKSFLPRHAAKFQTGNEIGRATRLNSSHSQISYAVFCLKKKKQRDMMKSATLKQCQEYGE